MASIVNNTALFIDALVRIGFNTVTANDIFNNGFDTIDILSSQEDKDTDDLVRYIGRWLGTPILTRTAPGVPIAPTYIGNSSFLVHRQVQGYEVMGAEAD